MGVFRRKKNGFVLIEMLVVAALFCVILVVLYSGYSLGIHVWRIFCESGIAANRQVWLGLEKVSRDIKSSFACNAIEFAGDEYSFSFPSVQDYEVVQIEYFYEKGKNTLYRTITKYADLLKDKKSKEKREIFKAERLEFSYLYLDLDKNTFYWSSEWLLESEAPKAVGMKFKLNDKVLEKLIFIPAA